MDAFLTSFAKSYDPSMDIQFLMIPHLRSSLDKLDCLRRVVDTIRAAISDSRLEEKQADECFLFEICAAFYDAEDALIDYCSPKQDSFLRDLCSCFPARKFNRIDERIHGLFRSNMTPRPTVDDVVRTRESVSFIIGRHNDKEKVMDFLFGDSVPMVLAIVGIRGIGKTALARLVFSGQRVSSQFDMRLWFTVNRLQRLRLVDIVYEFFLQTGTTEAFAKLGSDWDLIQRQLRQVVEGKRFLLVLDGLEDQALWEELYSLLNGVGVSHGSKILLTSRNHEKVRAKHPVHVLEGLSEEESLSLLMNIAPGDKVYEWNKILFKSDGVPLAIVTAAMNLWTSGHTIHGVQYRSILLALKTSYDSLPSYLKEFVAYCSLFPRECVYSVKELPTLNCVLPTLSSIELENPRAQELELVRDLASFFNFQDSVRDVYGNIIGFRMHPLLHDLARFVNKGFCTYVEKSDFRILSENNLHVSFSGVLHHDDLLNQLQRANNARLLIFVNGAGYLVREPELEYIFKYLKRLRTLGIQNLPVSALSSLLGTLKYLRHLNLSESVQLAALPVSIGKLFDLETLILRNCCSLKELPISICQLFKLKKLDLSGCSSLTHLPSGIDELTSLVELDLSGCSSLTHLPTGLWRLWRQLQILGLFVIGKKEARNEASLNECRHLERLKGHLEIKHLHRVADDSSLGSGILENKRDLQSLKFCWDSFDVISQGKRATADFVLKKLQPHRNLKGISIHGYCGHDADGLSKWLSRRTNLIKIEIGDCNWCTSLTPLHTLPHLKSVKLCEMRELEYFGTLESLSSEGFFPALEELSFKYMPKLKGWQRRSSSTTSAEETDEGDDLIFPTFSADIHLDVDHTRSFSYAHGPDSLSLVGTSLTDPILQRWVGQNIKGKTSSSESVNGRVIPFTSICSISLSQLRTFKIHDMGDITSLPEQLLQQLSSLQHLEISHGRFLTTLSGMVILQHLIALETLILVDFPELDFSTEKDTELVSGKLKDRSKLRRVQISAVPKMKSLPLWFQHLTELEELVISDCVGLTIWRDDPILSKITSLRSFEISGCKFLRYIHKEVIIHLITTLESLKICSCPELDLTARPVEENTTWRLQPPSRLRHLHIQQVNNRMKRLPWWIQHLGSLEILEILSCKNLEILPYFLTKLGSLREIRIEYCGKLSECCGAKRISVTSIYHLPRISRSPMMQMLFRASEAAKRSREREYKVLVKLYTRFGEAKDAKEQHKGVRLVLTPGTRFGSSVKQNPVGTFLRSLNPIANKRAKRRQELHGPASNWPMIERL